MPSSEIEKLDKHQNVYVEYLPDKPHVLRFSDDHTSAWLLLPISIFFFYFQFKVLRSSKKK